MNDVIQRRFGPVQLMTEMASELFSSEKCQFTALFWMVLVSYTGFARKKLKQTFRSVEGTEDLESVLFAISSYKQGSFFLLFLTISVLFQQNKYV